MESVPTMGYSLPGCFQSAVATGEAWPCWESKRMDALGNGTQHWKTTKTKENGVLPESLIILAKIPDGTT